MSKFTYELNEFDKPTFKDKFSCLFFTVIDVLLSIVLYIPYKVLKLFGKEPTIKDVIILEDFDNDLN